MFGRRWNGFRTTVERGSKSRPGWVPAENLRWWLIRFCVPKSGFGWDIMAGEGAGGGVDADHRGAGVGKSMLALEIVARLTTGRAWPDGQGAADRAYDVIYVGGEDDLVAHQLGVEFLKQGPGGTWVWALPDAPLAPNEDLSTPHLVKVGKLES